MKRVVAVNLAALWAVWCSTAAAQPVRKADGKRTIDITVTRYVVDARGERIGAPSQTVRYHLSRIRTDAGSTTTMTVAAPEGATAQEVARNPMFGGRVEFDSTGQLTMFDGQGRPLSLPAGVRIPALPLMTEDWSQALDGLSTDDDSRRARLKELELKYGKPASSVRGLAQYLRRTGRESEELLVDQASGVAVELNMMEGDQLKGRLGFEYAEEPDRRIRRRATRSEFTINEEGHRAITIAEFSRVRIEEEN